MIMLHQIDIYDQIPRICGGLQLVFYYITSVTRAEMHLLLIISINLYDRNGIKFNALASSDVIVLNLIIIHII